MAEKLSTKVYYSIRDDIISGAIGSKTFLNEGEVGAKFGVSRAPVRDALHLLCEQGYLISFPRKGYMVNTYTNAEINKMQEIRLWLERLSIHLAILNATDEEIESLREFTREQYNSKAPEQSNNFKFHMRLAEIGDNEFLPLQLKDLVNKASLSRITSDSDLKRHDAIVDALLKRDEKEAVRRLDEDIDFF